jgi:hypothetical protein
MYRTQETHISYLARTDRHLPSYYGTDRAHRSQSVSDQTRHAHGHGQRSREAGLNGTCASTQLTGSRSPEPTAHTRYVYRLQYIMSHTAAAYTVNTRSLADTHVNASGLSRDAHRTHSHHMIAYCTPRGREVTSHIRNRLDHRPPWTHHGRLPSEWQPPRRNQRNWQAAGKE